MSQIEESRKGNMKTASEIADVLREMATEIERNARPELPTLRASIPDAIQAIRRVFCTSIQIQMPSIELQDNGEIEIGDWKIWCNGNVWSSTTLGGVVNDFLDNFRPAPPSNNVNDLQEVLNTSAPPNNNDIPF